MPNNRKPRIGKICPSCGNEFLVTFPKRHQRYCSIACFAARAHTTMFCENCCKEFPIRQFEEDRKYCSRVCANTSNAHIPTKKVCPNCNREFEFIDYNGRAPQTYCSQECYLESVRVKDRKCPQCGEMFTPKDGKKARGQKQKYCSPECQALGHRSRVTLKCRTCGKHFSAIQSTAQKRKYCSRKCQLLSQFSSTEELEVINIVSSILEEKPIRQHTFPWLRNHKTNRPMHIDAFFPRSNIILEYDGKQHREFMPFYHKSKKQFADLQERDKIKDQLFQEHGIILVRIQDNEPKTIEYITRVLNDKINDRNS